MAAGVETVKLNCPNHHDLLIKGLWQFFQHEHAVDFDVEIGRGRPLRAHRLILEVFLSPEDIGEHGIATSARNNADLKGIVESAPNPASDWSGEGELYSLLLKFLYTGSVEVQQERLNGMLQLATVLNFKQLADAVEDSRRKCEESDESTMAPEATTAVRTKPANHRKPRKSTPKKSRVLAASSGSIHSLDTTVDHQLDTAEEVDECLIVRRSMPRRLAKDLATEMLDQVIDDEVKADDDHPSSGRRIRRFACPKCSYKSYNRSQINMHVARHDAGSLFRCKICTKVYLTGEALARHQRRIHTNDPATWRCTLCDVELRTSNTLRIHRMVTHNLDMAGRPVKRNFKCEHDNCQESFVFKSKLDFHVATKHTGERRHRCPDCAYSAFTISDLKKHSRFKHTLERPHVCEICGFSTVTSSNMVKHRRTHSKEKPFICECGKAYADKATLKEHAVRHQEGYSDEKARTHMCDVCGKGFLNRKHLLEHLRKVHRTGIPASQASAPSVEPKAPPSQTQLLIPPWVDPE